MEDEDEALAAQVERENAARLEADTYDDAITHVR